MRIEFIDKLKGYAILLVIMGHITEKSMNIHDSSFNIFYSSFHMSLFMFLSGLFAMNSFKEWNSKELLIFIKKKSLRILLPFVTVGGLYSFLLYNNVTVIYTGIGGYWFLPALFYCMLTEMLVGLFLFRFPLKGCLLDLFFHFGVWGVLSLIYLKYDPIIPFYLHFVKHYPFFVFGVFCIRYQPLYHAVISSRLLMTVSCLLYVIFLPSLSFFPIKVTGFFAIIICMQMFLRFDKQIPHILSLVGRSSLAIYVFHWFMLPSNIPITHLLSNALGPYEAINNENFILIACFSFALSLPIAFFCYILERIIQQSKWLNLFIFGTK